MGNFTFIQITDTHIGPSTEHKIGDVGSHEQAARLVEHLNGLTFPREFVVHTGDVLSDPNPLSTAAALEIFSKLRTRALFLPGNHDDPQATKELMVDAPVDWIPTSSNRIPFSFEMGGHHFVALDAVRKEPFYGAELPADQLDAVAKLIERGVPSLTVFIHYPTLPVGVPWIDRSMLLWNGADLHAVLRTAKPGVVKAVLSGHVHRPFTVVQDGIAYSSAASGIQQFRAYPEPGDADSMPSQLPGYAVMHLSETRASLSHHTFDK
jgi:Icc protein